MRKALGLLTSLLLTVLGLLLAWDIPLGEAVSALAASQAACGRMERLGGANGRPLAVVANGQRTRGSAGAILLQVEDFLHHRESFAVFEVRHGLE